MLGMNISKGREEDILLRGYTLDYTKVIVTKGFTKSPVSVEGYADPNEGRYTESLEPGV